MLGKPRGPQKLLKLHDKLFKGELGIDVHCKIMSELLKRRKKIEERLNGQRAGQISQFCLEIRIVQLGGPGNFQHDQIAAQQGQPVEDLFTLFARPSILAGQEKERRVSGVSSLLQQSVGVLPPGKGLTDISLHPGIQAPFGECGCDSCCGLVYPLLDEKRSNIGGGQGTKRDLLTTRDNGQRQHILFARQEEQEGTGWWFL